MKKFLILILVLISCTKEEIVKESQPVKLNYKYAVKALNGENKLKEFHKTKVKFLDEKGNYNEIEISGDWEYNWQQTEQANRFIKIEIMDEYMDSKAYIYRSNTALDSVTAVETFIDVQLEGKY